MAVEGAPDACLPSGPPYVRAACCCQFDTTQTICRLQPPKQNYCPHLIHVVVLLGAEGVPDKSSAAQLVAGRLVDLVGDLGHVEQLLLGVDGRVAGEAGAGVAAAGTGQGEQQQQTGRKEGRR